MNNDIIIQNDTKQQRRKQWVIMMTTMAFLVVIIVIVIMIMIGLNSRRKDVVKIANIDEIGSSIPGTAQEEFGACLYHLLRQHFEVPEDGSEIIATVRPETYEPVATGQVETVKFVIDVEDYKQSYRALLSWSDSLTLPESVNIECVKKQESKYDDTMCYGMSTTSESIKTYLPYEYKLDSGESVKLEYGFTTSEGKDIVKVVVASCGNKAIENHALSYTKSWVGAQGAKVDDIIYKVEPVYENCIIKGEN